MGLRHKPMIGREEGVQEPLHFYAQIKDEEDIAMLIVPSKFREVMKQWFMLKPPCVARLPVNKCCVTPTVRLYLPRVGAGLRGITA